MLSREKNYITIKLLFCTFLYWRNKVYSSFVTYKNILLIQVHLALTSVSLELSDFHNYIGGKTGNCEERTNTIQS